MIVPLRVQRSRAKGHRTPPNTVNVARPSHYGNPFRVVCLFDHRARGGRAAWGVAEAVQLGSTGQFVVGFTQTHDEAADARSRAVALYREAIADGRLKIDLAPLRGKNLSCWCPLGHPCHADVLLELANG